MKFQIISNAIKFAKFFALVCSKFQIGCNAIELNCIFSSHNVQFIIICRPSHPINGSQSYFKTTFPLKENKECVLQQEGSNENGRTSVLIASALSNLLS